jgi:hypothetical protein
LKRNVISSINDKLVRKTMVSLFSKKLKLYVVTEYPKSGGSWVSQMLSEYLKVPFPRNRIPLPQSCIMHGHYLYSKSLSNVFVVFRDGRDIVVSWYYHCFFVNDKYNERLVAKMRKLQPYKDYKDIKKNLPIFIEFIYNTAKPIGFTWSDFVRNWYGKQKYIIRYEKLKEDCACELNNAIKMILNINPNRIRLEKIAKRYSFNELSKRKPGNENKNSFLRKGIVGDWKNCFTKKASEKFDQYAGKELILLGYEHDKNWY